MTVVPPVRTTAGRDLRLDALRGIFILSMTAGHLAPDTWIDYASHPLRWVDGAPGFVLFSGLVLGMMQRGLTARAGEPAGRSWLWRRARFLYLVHVGLTLTGVLVRSGTGRLSYLPSVGDLGGPLPALVGVLTLQVQPAYMNVLPLYVVLLGVAAPLTLAAVRRGRWQWPLVLSLLLYLAGQAHPHLVDLADLSSSPNTWSWASWQLLFVGGFVAGWHWRALVRPWLSAHRRILLVGSAGTVAVLAFAGNAYDLLGGAGTRAEPLVVELFEKYSLRPGVIALLFAAVAVSYALLGRIRRGTPGDRIAAFLATIGSRSLDCYLLLSVVQLALFAAWPQRPVAGTAAVLVLTVAAMWVLARHRRRPTGPVQVPVVQAVPTERLRARERVAAGLG